MITGMPTLWAQVSLSMSAGYEDAQPTNTFWFSTVVATTPYVAIGTAIQDAYNEVVSYFPGRMNQNGHIIKMYDIADPKPRAPVYETTFGLSSSPSGNSLPAEVALCLSFQGERQSGVSQARRRGRVYIGPLDVAGSDADGRPTSGLVNAVVDMGESLWADSNAATDWSWVVYSRVDEDVVAIDNGWVDNSFDTQRRRGLDPTSRTTLVL